MTFNMSFKIRPCKTRPPLVSLLYPEMVLNIKDTPLEFVLMAKYGRLGKELPLPRLLTTHPRGTSWMSRMTDGD